MTSLAHIPENTHKLNKRDRVIGFYLYDKFNEVIAKVDSVVTNHQTYQCHYLIINLGGFLKVSGKLILVPVEICEVIDLGKIKTEWRKESMLDAPSPINVKNITGVEEEMIRNYYGVSLKKYEFLKSQIKFF